MELFSNNSYRGPPGNPPGKRPFSGIILSTERVNGRSMLKILSGDRKGVSDMGFFSYQKRLTFKYANFEKNCQNHEQNQGKKG